MTEPGYLRGVRATYDRVAADYAALLRDELDGKPLDRALLDTFAELVAANGQRPVADLGCGPGRIAAHLHARGLPVFGIDLSPAMVAVARELCPDLRFEAGSMLELGLGDDGVGGIVAWYSIIHTPPEQLPVVFAEFHRVLAPGGYALLAFQVGDGPVRLETAYGHAAELDAYRLSPDAVSDLLGDAGLVTMVRVRREPDGREKTEQAYLLARKPVGCER